MTNEEQKLREIVERWMGKKHPITMQSYVSDLTALISEHYVAKAAYIALENTLAKAEAKNLELLQQRDELKEALKLLMAGVNRLPPLTGIHGALENQYKIAEAAIKKTEKK